MAAVVRREHVEPGGDLDPGERKERVGKGRAVCVDDGGIANERANLFVSGVIAAKDLVGKKVVVVANLQPAKLMGIESQGMVLAGEGGQGFAVVMPDRDLPPGAKVK